MAQLEIKQQRLLKKLLRRPDIWRGESHRFSRGRSLKTGYAALDKSLVQQGWPFSGLIEITQSNLGSGEWQLFAPALRSLGQSPGYIVLISPPELPYAPGLKALGLNLNELMIVNPKNRADAVAAFIEILRSSACKALLSWENQMCFRPQELRKLQLAAAGSQALCLLFRDTNVLRQNSPAVLRLYIEMNTQQIQVQLLKQRGAFQHRKVHLDVPEAWSELPALSSNEWLESDMEVLTGAQILPFPQR